MSDARNGDVQLLAVARASVAHGVEHGAPLAVDPGAYEPSLREPRACFVTLRAGGDLRGCVGSLEARSPLVVETAHNAYRAAFEDRRFHLVQASELPGLTVSVSILSPLEALDVDSEADLLRTLRREVDGLVLRGGGSAATFLPAVWQQLPDPAEFVRSLKRKAGLSATAWSSDWRCERFTAREIH